MAVYKGEKPEFFATAMESVEKNTIHPTEIILVQDGPITNGLQNVLNEYMRRLPIKLIVLPVNQGLGQALQVGLLACSYDWVARFDTDDICDPYRFSKQLDFIKNNPSIDAFSAPILEFSSSADNGSTAIRHVPVGIDKLRKYAKYRNPFNHMSVMFKKEAVLAAGGYCKQTSFEDYSLWVRMLMKGFILDNMDEIVVQARADDAILKRRGGVDYVKNEISMFNMMRKIGFITYVDYCVLILTRLPIRLIPKQMRLIFYKFIMRSRK